MSWRDILACGRALRPLVHSEWPDFVLHTHLGPLAPTGTPLAFEPRIGDQVPCGNPPRPSPAEDSMSPLHSTLAFVSLILTVPGFSGGSALLSNPETASGMGREAEAGKPVLTVLKNQRMLVVTMAGDPSKVGDKAMKILYGIFFRNATEAEKNAPLSPRVRWILSSPDAPRSEWIGKYALPVSPEFPGPRSGAAYTEEWRYGLVAQMLHAGAYEKEYGSIAALKDFIARNGFTISGDFEEEYVQGRGTFYEGAPESYRTVLRFPVDNIQDFPKSYPPLSSF
jgi:hypothetical protein